MNITRLSWREVFDLTRSLSRGIPDGSRVWGIPRGGGYVAALMYGNDMGSDRGIRVVSTPEEATVAVDDVIDSGRTLRKVSERYGLRVRALIDKRKVKRAEWIVFPWEEGWESEGAELVTRMIEMVGDDPTRDGLIETPERVVSAWRELYAGYAYDREALTRLLKCPPADDPAEADSNPVLISDIRFSSMCEHHLMPFSGTVEVEYLPLDVRNGISNIPRVIELISRKLQVQEHFTQEIVDVLSEVTRFARVKISASHTCAGHRGHDDGGTVLTTHAEARQHQGRREDVPGT